MEESFPRAGNAALTAGSTGAQAMCKSRSQLFVVSLDSSDARRRAQVPVSSEASRGA